MMRLMLIAVTILFAGCALQPDVVGAGIMHQSQPFTGKGPPPLGDYDKSEETNFETLGGFVRWETERTFIEANTDYVVRSSNLVGGPWLFTVRAGVKVDLR